jgi:hypothetical protein
VVHIFINFPGDFITQKNGLVPKVNCNLAHECVLSSQHDR